METSAFRENNNAEMLEHESEISDLQKYLEKLIAEEKEVMIFSSDLNSNLCIANLYNSFDWSNFSAQY